MSKSEQRPAKIRPLPRETVEKISAGEVIERPASVVKELVENSLDAGARRIVAEIESSGRKLIRVSDDGCGIAREDLPAVFRRYATSKISSYDDLFSLDTMGFRGEALAAVSAVAEVVVSSSPPGAPGAGIVSNFGRVSDVRPSPLPRGTVVEVSRLFFNTPARLKFLKSDSAEKNACVSVVQALALGAPGVGFEFISDGKKIFSLLPREDFGDRAADVLKKEIFVGMKKFSASAGAVAADGCVSGVDSFVGTRAAQYVLVNRRPVFSKTVSKAVYEAVREHLPTGRHPAFVVHVAAAPETVDVNVSPAKREIKFSDEDAVFSAVFAGVKKSMSSCAPVDYRLGGAGASRITDAQKYYAAPAAAQSSHAVAANPAETQGMFSIAELANSRVKFLGEALGYCLVAADEKNIYLIDVHAASERILYEHYRKPANRSSSQMLTAPVLINLPAEEFSGISEKLETLNSIGWRLSVFGESALKCEGIPAAIAAASPSEILSEIFSARAPGASGNEDELIKRSCRAAVRGKDKLSFMEAQKLVNDLFETENYQTCPHGRPTLIKISAAELAAGFRRHMRP